MPITMLKRPDGGYIVSEICGPPPPPPIIDQEFVKKITKPLKRGRPPKDPNAAQIPRSKRQKILGATPKGYIAAPVHEKVKTFTKRPCMCCRTEFNSEGFHHRLCGFCRHGSQD